MSSRLSPTNSLLSCSTALAMVGTWLSRDLAEADYWRLLDALTLIALTRAATSKRYAR